jgi:hypothetical protein
MGNLWSHSMCWVHLCKTQKPKSSKLTKPKRKIKSFSLNKKKKWNFRITKKIAQVSKLVVIGRAWNFGRKEKEGDGTEKCKSEKTMSCYLESSELLMFFVCKWNQTPTQIHHCHHFLFFMCFLSLSVVCVFGSSLKKYTLRFQYMVSVLFVGICLVLIIICRKWQPRISTHQNLLSF